MSRLSPPQGTPQRLETFVPLLHCISMATVTYQAFCPCLLNEVTCHCFHTDKPWAETDVRFTKDRRFLLRTYNVTSRVGLFAGTSF